jgi:hypothetical protein
MEAKPCRLAIWDGQYAQGKKIQVTLDNQYDAVSTVLEKFEFLRSIQQPGEEITLECKSVITERGNATSCQVSLIKHSDSPRFQR